MIVLIEQTLGLSSYEIYNNTFPSVKYGIFTSDSGLAENSINCNGFSDSRDGIRIATLGNNKNLTMHTNEFDMSDNASVAIFRAGGDIFKIQSSNYNVNEFLAENPSAGIQFFNVGFDLVFLIPIFIFRNGILIVT